MRSAASFSLASALAPECGPTSFPPGVPRTRRRRGGGFIREDWGRRKRARRSPEPLPGPLAFPRGLFPSRAPSPRGAGRSLTRYGAPGHCILRSGAGRGSCESTQRPRREHRGPEAQRPEGAQRRPAAASQSHELGLGLHLSGSGPAQSVTCQRECRLFLGPSASTTCAVAAPGMPVSPTEAQTRAPPRS